MTESHNQTPMQDEMTEEMNQEEMPPKPKGKHGFASMDPELRRKISAKGGRAAHEQGTAHKFTKAEASAAGRKGGLLSQARARAEAKNGEEGKKPAP